MKATTILVTLLFSIISFGQTIESKIKAICQCQPLSFYPKIKNNKIFFTKIKTDYLDDEPPFLYLSVHEKLGTHWIEESMYKIDDESEFYSLEESENSILIDDSEFFYSIYSAANNGTAYNGRGKFIFIFQNTSQITEPVVVYFTKWAGYQGEYTVKNKNNISSFKSYLQKCSEFVDKTYGAFDDDVNSQNNYHIKWRIENEGIFKSIEYEQSNISYKPTEFSGKNFYTEQTNRSSQINNEKYFIDSGFGTPVIAYNIKKDISQVIFIPEGWPNGASWGTRSYYIKSVIGDIATAESDDYILKIDLSKNELSATKK